MRDHLVLVIMWLFSLLPYMEAISISDLPLRETDHLITMMMTVYDFLNFVLSIH